MLGDDECSDLFSTELVVEPSDRLCDFMPYYSTEMRRVFPYNFAGSADKIGLIPNLQLDLVSQPDGALH